MTCLCENPQAFRCLPLSMAPLPGPRPDYCPNTAPALLQELLADRDVTIARKKRYGRLMEEADRHKKVKRRKTDLARNKKKPAKPKH